VAVSSRIYASLPPDRRGRLLHDSDGIWYLDYFSDMLTNIAPAERKKRTVVCAELIDDNVNAFEKVDKVERVREMELVQGSIYHFDPIASPVDGFDLGAGRPGATRRVPQPDW
jgi:hypothetical protein